MSDDTSDRKQRLRDFKLVLLAVEEAIARGVTDEKKVVIWSRNYAKSVCELTKERVSEILGMSLRDLLEDNKKEHRE